MIYRLAEPADVSALYRVEKSQQRAAHWDEKGWQTELTDACSCVWCAQEGEAITGFVVLRLAAGMGEVLNVAIDPAYCRRGIGQELLSRALDWARAHGGEEITLEVARTNLPAVCLYQKVGFVPVGVRKNFYEGNEDALILKLNL